MKKLNCIRFTLTVQFDEENFKKKEFLSDLGLKKIERGKLIAYSYGSKNKRKNEHSHLFLILDKKDSSLQLVYHSGKAESEDVREPYMEDCPKWIDAFLKKEEYLGNISATFVYPKEFESVLKLQYPVSLLLGSELFQDASLTGHQIEFPEDSEMDRIFLSAIEDETAVVAKSNKIFKLADFDVYSEIKQLSEYTQSLVKKREKEND